MMPITILAYDAYIDGIYYDFSGNNATVTYKDDNYNSYCGSVNIPASFTYNSKTYSVTSIGVDAFYNCSDLTSVTISKGVTSIGVYAFCGCTGLTSVTIPNSVTSIGDQAFQRCTSLTFIFIPESVTSIGDGAFSACSTLTTVKVERATPVKISNYTFSNRANATHYVPEGSLSAYKAADYWKGFKNIKEYIPEEKGIYYKLDKDNMFAEVRAMPDDEKYSGDIIIPSSFTYDGETYIVTSIGKDAFYECSGMTSVTIPNSVTSIGNSAFSGCSGLTSITIPNSLTSISYGAFSGCSGLTSITIPNSVTSIGHYAFSGCSLTFVHITDIAAWCNISFGGSDANPLYYAHLYMNGQEVNDLVIPEGVTSISDYAFCYCSGLTSVAIGNSVTSIGDYAFSGCEALISITIPNSVTSIGDSAFSGCSGLTSITIPESVTSIGNWVFSGCSSLTSITIPNSVTSIGHAAFSVCYGLTSVTIPNSVTTIGSDAFEHCTSLTSITIPESVTSIGGSAFSGCSSLTIVKVRRTTPITISSYTFSNRANATLCVPEGSLSAYKAAAYWKEFKVITEDIPEANDIYYKLDKNNMGSADFPGWQRLG